MGRILEQLKGQGKEQEKKKRAGRTGTVQVGQGKDWQNREWMVNTRKKLIGQGQKKEQGGQDRERKFSFRKLFYALIKEGLQYMYMNIYYVYFMIFNV